MNDTSALLIFCFLSFLIKILFSHDFATCRNTWENYCLITVPIICFYSFSYESYIIIKWMWKHCSIEFKALVSVFGKVCSFLEIRSSIQFCFIQTFWLIAYEFHSIWNNMWFLTTTKIKQIAFVIFKSVLFWETYAESGQSRKQVLFLFE